MHAVRIFWLAGKPQPRVSDSRSLRNELCPCRTDDVVDAQFGSPGSFWSIYPVGNLNPSNKSPHYGPIVQPCPSFNQWPPPVNVLKKIFPIVIDCCTLRTPMPELGRGCLRPCVWIRRPAAPITQTDSSIFSRSSPDEWLQIVAEEREPVSGSQV
jgi:hypothetical protein